MSTPVGEPTPEGRWYVPEPWDTPERQQQAIAHERSLLQRRRRQRLIVAGILLAMLLVFLLALTRLLKRDDKGGSTAQPTQTCPTQTVAKPAETRVRVLNATGRSGLAAGVAKTLKSRGYDVETVSNAQAGTGGSSPAVVIYGAGQQARARAVGAQVSGARLRSDSRTSDTVDLILGSSFHALRSAQEAAPQLKQIDIPAGCPTGS